MARAHMHVWPSASNSLASHPTQGTYRPYTLSMSSELRIGTALGWPVHVAISPFGFPARQTTNDAASAPGLPLNPAGVLLCMDTGRAAPITGRGRWPLANASWHAGHAGQRHRTRATSQRQPLAATGARRPADSEGSATTCATHWAVCHSRAARRPRCLYSRRTVTVGGTCQLLLSRL